MHNNNDNEEKLVIRIVFSLSLLLLNSCAAFLVGDALFIGTTGKPVGNYVVEDVMGKDCSIKKAVDGKEPCVPYKERAKPERTAEDDATHPPGLYEKPGGRF
jgi:hypothetical protein